MIENVYYYSKFKKSSKKYKEYRDLIKEKIYLFLKDPFDKSLRTHKLSGKLSNYWSFSINYHLRIIFEFIDDSTVGFLDIGTHEIYK